MSSFRPKGVSAQRGPRTNRTQNNYPRDRLAVVDGYDLATGTMNATEMDTGVKLAVTVQPRKNAPDSAGAAAAARGGSERKWTGSKIDALMAESVVPGSWVILERTQGNDSIMRGKDRVLPVQAGWIKNVSEPRPDKCFTGIFTVNAFRNHIENIQAWNEKALDANDQEALTAFGEELDAIHDAFKARERPIRKGFQFRIVKEVEPATEGKGDKPGRPAVYEVVDMSYPIDWLNSESEDPDDYGAPPTNAQFQDYVNGYIDHVWGAADGSTPPKFPEDELGKMRFEIATYRIFKAGDVQYNERMLIQEPTPGQFPSPLAQLASTPTRYSEGEDFVVGKNWAVRGILQLINDSFDKKSNPPKVIQNFMARELFAHGPRANVQAMIATSDGGRAKVAPSLDRVLEKREAPARGSNAGGSELSAPSGDALTAPADPFGATADPFGVSDQADPFVGTEAPAPASAPASAPAQEQEDAAPSKTGAPRRFQRSSA